MNNPELQALSQAITDHVKQVIIEAAANAPRSRQTAIGPSEVGEPCIRRMVFKAYDWPAANTDHDPWASVIGTAAHAWLDKTFTALDPDETRYVTEKRLHIRPGLAGNSDMLDKGFRYGGTVLRIVEDWKISGTTSIAEYRRKGPGPKYRIQANLYGYGWDRAGDPPTHVAIVWLPRSHTLRDTYTWVEPYNRQTALDALARLDAVNQLVIALGDLEANPALWAAIPTADSPCSWCPWFKPGSTRISQGCPGHPGRTEKTDSLSKLIA